MRIAVIGSGIAGLSATWFLRKQDEVTLFERWPRLGMDAHTVDIDCGDQTLSINVPMRVFFPEYYPTLTALYQELGVSYEPVQYSGSFSHFGSDTYFRYRNYWLGSLAVPFLAGRSPRTLTGLKIGRELVRLLRTSHRHSVHADADALSLSEYLSREGYSSLFAEQFLYPTFAGICTCTYESIKAYPASVVLEYLNSGLTWSRVNKLTHGTRDVAERLAASAANVVLGSPLKSVLPNREGVQILDEDGSAQQFDHAVIATQANQALKLLPEASPAERAALQTFRYEKSRIVVHRDAALAPRNPAEWAPVNFLLAKDQDKPMASIALNRIHPLLKDQPDVFETWNPYQDIKPRDLLLDADLERPIVSQESLQGVRQLEALHAEPDRKIWFCGSYSRRGIPLLESAAASAMTIANRLNAQIAQS